VAVGRLKQREAVSDLLAAWRQKNTHDAAITALTELPDLRALDAYLAGWRARTPSLREKCAEPWKPSPGEALPLLQEQREKLAPDILSELRRVYAKDSAALASSLFARLPRPIELVDYERFALTHAGKCARGQELFFNAEGVSMFEMPRSGWTGAPLDRT